MQYMLPLKWGPWTGHRRMRGRGGGGFRQVLFCGSKTHDGLEWKNFTNGSKTEKGCEAGLSRTLPLSTLRLTYKCSLFQTHYQRVMRKSHNMRRHPNSAESIDIETHRLHQLGGYNRSLFYGLETIDANETAHLLVKQASDLHIESTLVS